MAAIKNIIFDLGGVLLDIDYHQTAKAFSDLGVQQFDTLYSQTNANELFEALETGTISEDDFYKSLQTYCRPATTRHQMQSAWNAILLNFRVESLSVLEELKKNYNIYLLSNTNSIHLKAFNQILLGQTGKSSLEGYFIKSYYSHLINKRKPNVSTYEWVLQDANIIAAETLFIDDSINNIIGAKEAGLQTHCLLPQETIQQLSL